MEFSQEGYSIWFLALIALAAALYSSVGQGGGSGYLAVMALYGMSPAHMKPAALLMNVFVTSVVWYRYYRRGDFKWSLFWPFAVASVPTAFIGGALTLHAAAYRLIVAVALLVASIRMLSRPPLEGRLRRPSWPATILVGAVLGLVSGTTGVGGGIFLSPLLLLFRWCSLHETLALSAGFIWVNSVAGISGYAFDNNAWPSGMPWLVAAALIGTAVGVKILASRGTPQALQRILGVVLMIAALRMLIDIWPVMSV